MQEVFGESIAVLIIGGLGVLLQIPGVDMGLKSAIWRVLIHQGRLNELLQVPGVNMGLKSAIWRVLIHQGRLDVHFASFSPLLRVLARLGLKPQANS